MNNKGQTLIIFVILIPIILIMIALIVDTGIMLHEKHKVEFIVDFLLEDALETKDVQKIKELLEKNEIPTENLQITEQEESISLHLNYSISSIFGNLIGIKKYEIQVKKKVFYDKEQIRIEKE